MNEKSSHEIRVTRLKNIGYGVRLFYNGELVSEDVAKTRLDIGTVARNLLRWDDKMGRPTEYSRATRHRQKNV